MWVPWNHRLLIPPGMKSQPQGNMHQVKDVKGGERRGQLQFYWQNVLHMAKEEDMLVKNHARLCGAKQGAKINWAALYIEKLQK